MIKNTFLFLPKISVKKEKFLWSIGIKTWDDFLISNELKGISKRAKKQYDKIILDAKKALLNEDSSFFLDKLPHKENWRLYDYFKEDTIFLDIETSGVYGYLTIVGLFDGYNTKIMIRDINLDINYLKNELLKYKLIITFNGSSFDLPFLKKRYNELIPKIPNIDLKYLCQKIGLFGGLKNIEKKLGIERKNKIVDNLYKGDPFKLWKIFKATGNKYYLDLLLEYNEEDVINLKKITDFCVSELKKRIFNNLQ